jgi:plasmid stability protein
LYDAENVRHFSKSWSIGCASAFLKQVIGERTPFHNTTNPEFTCRPSDRRPNDPTGIIPPVETALPLSETMLSFVIALEVAMGQVIVRNLDDHVIAALKAKAELHGQSLEQELRTILSKAASPNAQERIALADRIRALTPKRRQTDSTVLIRKDRDR